MSLLAIGIGAVAGGCAGFVVRHVNRCCVRWLPAGTTLAKLLHAYRGLLLESDWSAFQRAYIRLLKTSVGYTMARLLTAIVVVIPVLLLYLATSAVCQMVEPVEGTAGWFGAGEWSFWTTASLGTLLAAWLPGGKF